MINSALSRAFSAREKIAQAQQSAMDALNLPSASELEKLGRRLRTISQRLEEVEDAVDKIGVRMETLSDEARAPGAKLSDQLDRIEARLEQLGRDVARRTSREPPAIVQARPATPAGESSAHRARRATRRSESTAGAQVAPNRTRASGTAPSRPSARRRSTYGAPGGRAHGADHARVGGAYP